VTSSPAGTCSQRGLLLLVVVCVVLATAAVVMAAAAIAALSAGAYVTIYFASAAVAVDSSHMTASSSASWSRFSPPSNFVNGHVNGLSLATITTRRFVPFVPFVQVSTVWALTCPETGHTRDHV